MSAPAGRPAGTSPVGAGPVPTVSVVTAFLDAERFLEAAIASVLAQTCRSWELLLVDDGSRDRSSAIQAAARSPSQIGVSST